MYSDIVETPKGTSLADRSRNATWGAPKKAKKKEKKTQEI